MKKLINLLSVLLIMGVCSAFGQQYSISFAWNPSSSTGVVNYNLYQGLNTNSWVKTSIGNITNTTIFGLSPTNTYYFAVSAVDTNNIESSLSDIITSPTNGIGTIQNSIQLSWNKFVTNNGIVSQVQVTNIPVIVLESPVLPAASWTVYSTNNLFSFIPIGNGNEFFRLSAPVPLQIIESINFHYYP